MAIETLNNSTTSELIETLFPNIEPKVLEIYNYVEKSFPKALYSTDIPLDKNLLEKYTQLHSNQYELLAQNLLKQNWEVLVLGSGMYGGKSTLSFYLLDQMKESRITSSIYIADVMGEPTVTARSYPGEDSIRQAIPYGSTCNNLELSKKGSSVVLLDEFSFLDINSIKNFVLECRKNNVKVILTGLNTNYLGQELPVFQNLDSVIGEHLSIDCLSFVPNVDTNTPTGTSTVRYFKLNGRWILDMGILPLVVSKKNIEIVHYSPARTEGTFLKLLETRRDLQDFILSPSDELISSQKERLEFLLK